MQPLKQLITLGLALGLLSCSNDSSPTKPPEPVLPDTTSHEFAWEILNFGDGNASKLHDVCIIDEDDIWAVGEIFVQDSTGQFIDYNAVHWTGSEWEMIRIPVKIWNTNSFIIAELRAIYAFSHDDIIVTTGGEVIRYDGQQWGDWEFLFDSLQDTTFGRANSFWGTSSSDLWSVGDKGNIHHYDGQSWQKLDSGTEQTINDIWGVFDEQTQDYRIFCAVSSKLQAGEMKILQILPDNTVQEFNWQPQRSMHSIWFGENTPLYTCGDGFFIYEQNAWRQVQDLPKIYKNRVRGNHQFDVFVAGDFGLLAHFDGNDWKLFDSLGISTFALNGLAVQDDVVVAVGENGTRALIARGKRQE